MNANHEAWKQKEARRHITIDSAPRQKSFALTRPRIKFYLTLGLYICQGEGTRYGTGYTPKDAYDVWLNFHTMGAR